jgi:hypothetical protein
VGDETFPSENAALNRSLKSLVVLDCSNCTSYVDFSTVVALSELVVIFYREPPLVNCSTDVQTLFFTLGSDHGVGDDTRTLFPISH